MEQRSADMVEKNPWMGECGRVTTLGMRKGQLQEDHEEPGHF